MTTDPKALSRVLGATAGLLSLLSLPTQAWADPWTPGYRSGTVRGWDRSLPTAIPVAEGYDYDDRSRYPGAYGDPYARQPDRYAINGGGGYGSGGYGTAGTSPAARCNIGRLVGGLVGGGIGYAASRQDGRTWAVPLGALLGAQVGCNVGAGGAPLPW